MSFKIAQVDYDYTDNKLEKGIIEKAGGEIKSGHLVNTEDVYDFAKDCDAIMCQYVKITRELFERLPNIKVVSRYGIGVDNIDVEAAKDHHVFVVHNPVYCIEEVSNHALALIFSQYRQINQGNYQVKHGIWDFNKLYPIPAAENYTIGIVGLGHIGTRVAEKLKIFGFNLIGYDPYVNKEYFDKTGVKKVTLEQLMATADCVTIHCALTEETTKLIGSQEIDLMKTTSCLVNTARGPVVDFEALLSALEKKTIRGAGLDVLPEEPPQNYERIAQIPSLEVTPHLAFYSDTSLDVLRTSVTEQVIGVVKTGKAPQYNAYKL
ncbi:MAG: C-terminal binding protein [Peptostreptococcaceae bacterium]|nr:C-terminal binding protein [Peptostreptococcaceae bacterium]